MGHGVDQALQVLTVPYSDHPQLEHLLFQLFCALGRQFPDGLQRDLDLPQLNGHLLFLRSEGLLALSHFTR